MKKQNYKLYFHISLFIFFSLTFAGSIYGLAVASTSSLILSCYIGAAVCSTFFVCRAIYNTIISTATDKEHNTQENDIKTEEKTSTPEKTANIDKSPIPQADVPKLPQASGSTPPPLPLTLGTPPPPPPLPPASGATSPPHINKSSEEKRNNTSASSRNNGQSNAAITPDAIQSARVKLKKTKTNADKKRGESNLNVAKILVTVIPVLKKRQKQNCYSDDEELSDHDDWSDNEDNKDHTKSVCYYSSSLSTNSQTPTTANSIQPLRVTVTSQGNNKSQNSKENQQSGDKPTIPPKPKGNSAPTSPMLSDNEDSNTSNQLSRPIEAGTVSKMREKLENKLNF